MKLFKIISIALLIQACGAEEPKEVETNENSQSVVTSSTSNNANNQENTRVVPVNVFYSQNLEGSSLTSAQDFSVEATCQSGHTEIVDSSSQILEVPNDDVCTAKLISFDFGGKTFVADASFSTWQKGAMGLFVAEDGEQKVVTIVNQLSSDLASYVAFRFAETETIDANDIVVSVKEAPKFAISKIELVGITEDGAGQFAFELTCMETVIDGFCGTVEMSQISYKLVSREDTENLAAINKALSFDVKFVDSSFFIEANNDFNGGFSTEIVTGPSLMAQNSALSLVLQNDISYSVLDVNVGLK